jgi:magnesium-transporting ATPase (P-type)
MDKSHLMLTKQKSRNLLRNNKDYNRRLLIGSLLASIIGATPFLFYLYEYVPDTSVWETPLFTYESVYFESANIAFWVLSMKVIPLVLCLIWFFTCKHWWYHVLIVPIAMFSFQVLNTFNDDVKFIDEFHIIYLLPIMALVFPSIYLIRAKMFDKINEADKTMEELEEEFMIKPKGFLGKLKQYF